jgi:hypothetical protein
LKGSPDAYPKTEIHDTLNRPLPISASDVIEGVPA